MGNYYADNLNSSKLYQAYDTKIERVKQYLDAEISFVQNKLTGNEKVLELGAGFGRIMKKIAPYALSVSGIDIAEGSVEFGKEYLKDTPNCLIKVMDAHDLKFDSKFDVVLCLQNGISALKGDSVNLIKQTMKVLSNNGKAYFSSYSQKFWKYRLEWFHEQANKGLLGEIDSEKTKDGKIVCKDGFVSTAYTQDDIKRLGDATGYKYKILETDDSAIFLIVSKTKCR